VALDSQHALATEARREASGPGVQAIRPGEAVPRGAERPNPTLVLTETEKIAEKLTQESGPRKNRGPPMVLAWQETVI
jgi:hypothetical protein